MLKEESVADFYCRGLTAKEIYEKTTGSPLVLKNQTQNKAKAHRMQVMEMKLLTITWHML